MDATSQALVAGSTQAVHQVLETATNAVIKQAEKLMEATVRMAVGMEIGKGANIDVSA
ncbi:MAG: hypothetical protein JXA71_19250 [Chitinispirillaceae bacterium]|nr:hypothetical protein [Chitinispirillaceae bacterium]